MFEQKKIIPQFILTLNQQRRKLIIVIGVSKLSVDVIFFVRK